MQHGEMLDSRGGDTFPATETRRYWVRGSSDRVTVEAYAMSFTIPVLVTATATIYRQPIKIDWESSNYAIVTVEYKTLAESETPPSETGSLKWSFDTSGGTVNIKAGLSHVASYPAGATDHGGSIGVTKDGVEGTDIIIPALKLNVQFSHPLGVITLAKVKQLARATGTVCQSPFMEFAAGEVLYLGSTGSDGTDAPADVSHQFAASENLQNQIIAGIDGITKDGWDYAWVEFNDAVDGGKPAKTPVMVHVERVYRRLDFSDLFGFG